MSEIRESVWEFAKNYQQEAAFYVLDEKLSHPAVFVLDDGFDFKQFIRPGMFLCNATTSENIRAIKAEIQRNEAQLNIKRVNISVIVSAHKRTGLEKTAETLRALFEEDFPVVHISLYIMMSESNTQPNFEERSANTLRLLKSVNKKTPYNLVWLFSDRNEHDVVRTESLQNNLACIGLMHLLSSNFEESIRLKSENKGRPLYAPAGMAELTIQHKEIAFCVFRYVFSRILKQESKQDAQSTVSFTALIEHPAIQASLNAPISAEEMAGHLESVAESKVSGRMLHKKSIREVESLLFGERARLFFEANFQQQTLSMEEMEEILAKVMATVRENVERTGLSFAAFYKMTSQIPQIEERIKGYTQEIDMRYQEQYIYRPFSSNKIKSIAEIYKVKSQMGRLCRLRDIMAALEIELTAFCDKCEGFIDLLSRYGEELQAEKIPLHIPEYYENVAKAVFDSLLSSLPPLYPLVEGGPKALVEHIGDYVKKHILSHPTMLLSFEEDQEARADLSPNTYDQDFTNKSEFYSRIISDVDKKAALAISLKRYDDLVYEKYYLGDVNGHCMQYAKDLHGSVNESVYFLEDKSGFRLLRLAGGFVVEDLVRYEAMEGFG